MSVPRIGVTRWEDVVGERISAYHERVREAGGVEVDLGPERACASAAALVPELDGLVLTGGVDIDPSQYGAAPHPKTNRPRPERDAFERALLEEALARDLPVLAICRGHQLLNVVCGGALLQHIEDGSHRADYRAHPDGVSRKHPVALTGRLADIFGAWELVVNSRHHQAVTRETLAPGLRPLATSPDELVEAVELTGRRWVIGVQWHPERPEPEIPGFAEASRRLFAAFLEAAASGR
ncbi:MAG TPA: gamma-glutamyl-gamma-aminobutyrate hydrolase family protein [Dehalococcoidia bacterium]|nr:gamma-glutamyl-gamma-aminobutyrate hydrolase family protein [Dehalococcoidia bacterium]